METNPINQEVNGIIATLPLHQYQPNTWETERLFLRPFTAKDFADLYRFSSNPEVMLFIGKGAKTESETLVELISFITHWQQHNFGNFAIIHKASGKLIGRTGLYRNGSSDRIISPPNSSAACRRPPASHNRISVLPRMRSPISPLSCLCVR